MRRIVMFFTLTMVLVGSILSIPRVQAAERRFGNLLIEKAESVEGVVYELRQTHLLDESGALVEVDGFVSDKWTTSDGTIKLEGLPFGRYEVQEILAPYGMLVDSKTYTVTLPFYDKEEDRYVHNIHLYTQQEKFAGVKNQSPNGAGFNQVDEIEVAAGSMIDYHLQIPIPEDIHEQLESGMPKYTQLMIVDKLDFDLSFVEESLSLWLSDKLQGLQSGADYVLNFDEEAQVVQLTLTKAGLDLLTPNDVLEVGFSVKVDNKAVGSLVGNASKIIFTTQDEAGERAIHKAMTNIPLAEVEVGYTEAPLALVIVEFTAIGLGVIGLVVHAAQRRRFCECVVNHKD